MSVLKAEILTFINDNLHRTETAAKVAVPIQTVLNDLSNLNFLTAEDTEQTLTAGDTELVYPTLYKALVSIVLNDGSYDGAPLRALAGGYKEYLRLMENFNSGLRSEPEWQAEYESKFYPYPVAGQSYTVVIKYYKFHAQSVDAIEFGDEFRNCINYGAAFFVALKYGLSRYQGIWGPMYASEKETRRLSAPSQPYITRG